MPIFNDAPLTVSFALFALCALTIGVAGTRMTTVVDYLADRTGMGEAVSGAILLGAATSLSGTVLSITAAFDNQPDLAVGNALGGIAVQTAFLSVADLAYRGTNLEHAVASAATLMQGAVLICMLAVLLVAAYAPAVTFWSIHPATLVLVGTYIYGCYLVREAHIHPMWHPRQTQETRVDQPREESNRHSLTRLWLWFGVLALIMIAAGWGLEQVASQVVRQTGISESTVGLLLTSISTSLPELVTAIAAVRRGAVTLAVGGIIGGNGYDLLCAAFADMAYRQGSIYHSLSKPLMFWIALSILIMSVLLAGLIRRQKHGLARIGFESWTVLVLYLGGVVFVLFS